MDIEPGLLDYWRILRKRKWVVSAVAFLVASGTFVYTQMQIPLYRAQGVVRYEPPTGGKALGLDMSTWDQYTVMKTQTQVAGSSAVAERVSQRVGEKVAHRAEQIPDSNLITITVTHRSPVKVADIANAIMEIYMENDLEERSQATRKSLEDISSRRSEVEASLNELEEKKREYMETHPATGMGASLQNSLLELETRRKELLKKFTVEHPDVIAQDQRIESTRAKLAQTPGADLELDRLSRDIRVNEDIYLTLSKQVEETRVALSAIPSFVSLVSRAAVPRAPYYPGKRKNYTLGLLLGVVLGLVAAILIEGLDISISTIEDIEKFLEVPVLAIIPHLGSENKWEAFKTKMLRRPRYPIDTFRSLLLFHQAPKSQVAEVYHSMRSAIQAQKPEQEHWVLTFTSTGVAEGKTLTAINFCLAAAHAGFKVLMVGSDVRRPVVHRVFGLPKTPGLLDILTGKSQWREVARGTVDFLMGDIGLDKVLNFAGIDNFKVMTSSLGTSADIMNILSSPSLPRFIEEVRPHFDFVVFDCPPVLLFVDAVLIGAHCDGAVVVYQSGKMARQALKRAKDQLTTANVKICGVVLNDMQSSEMGPAYAYYYGYGHYAEEEV